MELKLVKVAIPLILEMVEGVLHAMDHPIHA
jgi:hypothetical protein